MLLNYYENVHIIIYLVNNIREFYIPFFEYKMQSNCFRKMSRRYIHHNYVNNPLRFELSPRYY